MGRTLVVEWSNVLPLTACCLSLLLGYESRLEHVKKLPDVRRCFSRRCTVCTGFRYFFKNLCIFVLWTNVSSALEGLKTVHLSSSPETI